MAIWVGVLGSYHVKLHLYRSELLVNHVKNPERYPDTYIGCAIIFSPFNILLRFFSIILPI